MRSTFNYVKTGIWYRPIIPVTLQFKKRRFNYLALLDSGADFNIFHSDLAEILEIDLTKAKSTEFGGIKQGALSIGYFTTIELGFKNQFKNVPVLFSNEISNNGYGILGQQGFFNDYKIAFNYQRRKITVQDN